MEGLQNNEDHNAINEAVKLDEASVTRKNGRRTLDRKKEPKTADTVAVFETYRKIVIHEDGLINWRVTWLVIFQGVLLTSFTQIGLGNQLPEDTKVTLRNSLQWIGLVHSLISFLGVLSATVAIRTLRAHYEKNHNFTNLPPLTGGGYRNSATNIGIAYHLLLPLLFFIIWTILLVS